MVEIFLLLQWLNVGGGTLPPSTEYASAKLVENAGALGVYVNAWASTDPGVIQHTRRYSHCSGSEHSEPDWTAQLAAKFTREEKVDFSYQERVVPPQKMLIHHIKWVKTTRWEVFLRDQYDLTATNDLPFSLWNWYNGNPSLHSIVAMRLSEVYEGTDMTPVLMAMPPQGPEDPPPGGGPGGS